MGTENKILTGARAQLAINGKIVGLFTDCSYGLNYDAQPAFILGRYSAAEITMTSQEVINVQANGFRVIDAGPHEVASIPKLQDLLNHEDISLSLIDRKTGKIFMTVVGVRPVSYSSGVNARGVTSVSCSFLGLRMADESGDQDESSGASTLFSGT